MQEWCEVHWMSLSSVPMLLCEPAGEEISFCDFPSCFSWLTCCHQSIASQVAWQHARAPSLYLSSWAQWIRNGARKLFELWASYICNLSLLKHELHNGASNWGATDNFLWKVPAILPQVKTFLLVLSIKCKVLSLSCCHSAKPSGAWAGVNNLDTLTLCGLGSSLEVEDELTLESLSESSMTSGSSLTSMTWFLSPCCSLTSSTCNRPERVSSGSKRSWAISSMSFSNTMMLAAAPSRE